MPPPGGGEAPVMVHAREVRPLRFRSGITAAQLLDVVRRRGDNPIQVH